MSAPKTLTFEFSDGTTHDASISEASVSQSIDFQHGWSIAPISESLGGGASPQYSIEVSNDNSNFYSYDSLTNGADITSVFTDTQLNWLYVRINYDARTNSTGTVNFKLILK